MGRMDILRFLALAFCLLSSLPAAQAALPDHLANWLDLAQHEEPPAGHSIEAHRHKHEPPKARPLDDLWDRKTLTGGWFGLGKTLEEHGVSVDLGLTQAYQINARGGLATHRRSGRYTGSYDLEIHLDTDKLFNLPGGRVYALAEGGWSRGIDRSSVGSFFGVNADAFGDYTVALTQLYYEQALLDDRVRIRVGKLDLTGGFECRGCVVSFDGNAFADDETFQFLNGSLVNNPTIPFPDYGLGAAIYVEPIEGFYLSAGAGDAEADFRETGFRTALHGRDHFFSVYEAGVTPHLPGPKGPMQGAYRVGVWHDGAPKERFEDGRTVRDDMGFYLSFDQVVLRESDKEDDSRGLGLFARYGLADGEVNAIRSFWSTGMQYQGLLPGRDEDVLGFGVGQGCLSRRAGLRTTHETALELYYNIRVTGWMRVSPSVQYVFNPGGEGADAVVLAVRAQINF